MDTPFPNRRTYSIIQTTSLLGSLKKVHKTFSISILDVHTGGDLPLQGLIRCYEIMLAALPEDDPFAALTANQYEEALADAREALANWDVPEEL